MIETRRIPVNLGVLGKIANVLGFRPASVVEITAYVLISDDIYPGDILKGISETKWECIGLSNGWHCLRATVDDWGFDEALNDLHNEMRFIGRKSKGIKTNEYE